MMNSQKNDVKKINLIEEGNLIIYSAKKDTENINPRV